MAPPSAKDWIKFFQKADLALRPVCVETPQSFQTEALLREQNLFPSFAWTSLLTVDSRVLRTNLPGTWRLNVSFLVEER